VKICPVCSTEYPDDVRFCPNDGQTLRASSPGHDLVGHVVADRYHVVKKLGEGGMGQVYLAEHVKMGRKSAIKVMNPALVHDPDAVARFNREASNASRITHPNVCAIYDFGETPDGLIYLAMEFIEGEPLTELMAREGALALPRAVTIFAQVADALQAAHDLGIVHRDLKPDNIMLTRGRDGADVVKVVDFGIAKAVGGDDTQKVTKTGLVVGTPEFMSPEQLSGDKLDGRSDIYSLALVLFKMLTGKLPFEATTVQETMIKRLTDDPVSLAAARPDLRFPPGLQETLDAALTRAPTDRYQSAAKFANDVAAVVGLARSGAGAPLPVTRADAQQTTVLLDAAPVKKRSILPIAVGAAVVLAAGGAGVALFGGGKRSGGTAQPDTTKQAAVAAPRPIVTQPGGLDPQAAGALLDRLIEQPTSVILDSAPIVYNTPGVKVKDRAFAACLSAQAYSKEGDNAKALQWARQGLRLDSSLESCRQVEQSAGGGGP
jgi:predicted Ser/Thr protein kinase